MRNLFICLALNVFSASSQTAENYPILPKEAKSPTAASLGLYGNIPVSYYSGQASLSIPLFSTEVHGVALDLALNYNSSGVVINSLPGWCGHNWSLNAGGVITRTVMQDHDEKTVTSNSKYYNNYFTCYNYLSSKAKFDKNKDKLLNEEELRNALTKPNDFMKRDLAPDIFTFNFMGITGRFFLGNDGQWKVDSDSNIDIEFDIKDRDNFSSPFIPKFPDGTAQPKCIRGFRLRDGNGIIYEFGDIDKTGENLYFSNATEYSMDFFAATDVDHEEPWIANAWYLRNVKDRYGNFLYRFYYRRGYFVAQFYNNIERLTNKEEVEIFGDGTGGIYNNYKFPYSAQLCSPIYLDEINCGNHIKIKFNNTDLGFGGRKLYPEAKMDRNNLIEQASEHIVSKGHNGNLALYDYYAPFYYLRKADSDELSKLQWTFKSDTFDNPLEYTRLMFLGNMYISATKSNEANESLAYYFTYDTSHKPHLLKLTKCHTIKGKRSNEEQQYILRYENFDKLPQSYTSTSQDHWGYYNNTPYNINSSPEYFPSWRKPNPNTMAYGILKSITYPTGGTTVFEYEPNTYSRFISEQRNRLIDENGIGGGVRIKSITDYEDSLCVNELSHRTFCYENANGKSSGTLYSKPIYYWQDWVSTSPTYNKDIHIYTARSSSMIPLYSYFGPSVGYDTVREVYNDGTSVEYRYSNGWEGTYKDNVYLLDFSKKHPTPYDRYSDKNRLRGKLIGRTTFDNSGNKITDESFTFSINSKDTFVVASNIMAAFYGNALSVPIMTGGVYKEYYGKSRLAKYERTDYSSSKPHKETTRYTNHMRLLDMKNGYAHKTEIEVITHVQKDFSGNRPCPIKGYAYMFDSDNNSDKEYSQSTFFIAPYSVNEYNNSGLKRNLLTRFSYFIKGDKRIYAPSLYIQRQANTADTLVRYIDYTQTGQPTLYKENGKPLTAIIWGNNDNYIIAKCSNVKEMPNIKFSDQDFWDNTLMVSRFNQYRKNNPCWAITSYTYDPLLGVTSITDSTGRTTTFLYDGFGRLTDMYDHKKVLTNHFEYYFTH